MSKPCTVAGRSGRRWARWGRDRQTGIGEHFASGREIPRADPHRDFLQRTWNCVPENLLRVQLLRNASLEPGRFESQLEHVCLDNRAAARQHHEVFLRIQKHRIDRLLSWET